MSYPAYTVRLSPALRALLKQVAGSEDAADALRALLILGAAQAGLDTAALRRDLGQVLELELLPEVQALLQDVYSGCNTKRIQREYKENTHTREAPIAVEPAGTSQHQHKDDITTIDDPFGSIGIEV